MTEMEKELCKQNFMFYDKQRQGSVERFELPMLLNGKVLSHELNIACGYHLTEQRISQLNEYLDKRKSVKIDVPTLVLTLNYLKELELLSE